MLEVKPLMETPKTDKLQGRKTLKVAGFLEEFEKDDIKKKVDIIDLFASFNVKLEKKGKSFMGLCPWHEDRTPSLSVDREKGLYNCFGCGEAGDAFDLVEKMKGYDFKEALAYLKNFKGGAGYVVKMVAPTLSQSVEGVKEKSGTEPVSLNTIRNYYHKRLFDHSEALEYLKKRGLANPALYERFQIGYCDGSLNLIVGDSQKEALTEAGIFSDSGKEHFLNCLVFPVIDENQNVVSFYGRDIDDSSGFKHRYLKGPHKGVFNRKASKVYDEIILAESIIDALSLIESGLENVQAIYGTNGFTDEHLEILKSDRVRTVVIALDNDEAGQKASEALKERLIYEGFKVKVIFPNVRKDWNEALVSGKLVKEEWPAALKTLIEQAAIFERVEELKEGFKVREEKGQYYFTYSDNSVPITYRLTGVKEMFVNSLKVTVKAESCGDYFIDTVDFYLYRSRSNFAAHLSSQFGMESKRIEHDLLDILEYLEKRKEERLKADEPKKIEISEDDREAALRFLKSPDLFKQVAEDMTVLGYVGEDLNKELLYLCASSRVLDDPISILILSESAAGKSRLVETVEKLLPPEDVVAITSLSDQALNYVEDFRHKFFTLGESVHSDIVEHQIREMLSRKELTRLVTLKDEKTGKLSSRLVKTPMIVASVLSTTNHNVNPENASRYFVTHIDESREQTRLIHELQRKKYSLGRHLEKQNLMPGIVRKHQTAQRLLRKILIVNPFGEYLNFPDHLMRTRRDNERFLDLIACVCFLRQYQKEVKLEGLTEYIECDLDDYRLAYEIMVRGILGATMNDIPHQAAFLYDELRRGFKEKAEEESLKTDEVSLTQREIRERTGLNQMFVKRYLRVLTDYEYIKVKGNRFRGSTASYSLLADEDMKKLDLSVIPTPEEMAGRRDMSKSGAVEEKGLEAL